MMNKCDWIDMLPDTFKAVRFKHDIHTYMAAVHWLIVYTINSIIAGKKQIISCSLMMTNKIAKCLNTSSMSEADNSTMP
jgi:hypothetical protein